jgi:ribosomal protein S18 acetylase RimI-like enzyme
MSDGTVIELVDRYLDAAPRSSADAVDTGAFTLFVGRGPWSYYARPALASVGPIATADLDDLAAACVRHRVPLALEWIHEARPELAQVARSFGLRPQPRALLVAAPHEVLVASVPDVRIWIADHDDPDLAAGRAVAEVAFGCAGTDRGSAGAPEREEARRRLAPELVDHLRRRAAQGLNATALAATQADGVVATASYQPVAGTAEVVSVATLPCARRRGIAGALTGLLAQHAHANAVGTLLLTATDDDVARIYERVGFRSAGRAFDAHAAA